ncbi:MAG: UDP-N-acetylmuramoyl-tripeptide--D-alanyl-D-alanine ligase [Candidatus Omnitrophota bacterium]
MLRVDEILKAVQGKLVCGSRNKTVRGYSIDSRAIKKGEAFIAIKGDKFDGHDFIPQALKKGASCVIACAIQKPSAAGRATFIEVNDTQKALAGIARALRVKYDIPVIAITGSAGKTTVKEMLAWVLSAKLNVLSNEGTKNNHIGMPITLCGLNKSHNIAVLELGTNHFGEIKNLSQICLPDAAVVTNIGPAHLEHFNNLEGVLKEKYTLVENLRGAQLAVLNADDAMLSPKLLNHCAAKPFILGFGINNSADFLASDIRLTPGGIKFLINGRHKFSLNTCGRHNVYNALAAVAAARAFGIEYKTIIRRLASFTFPAGRLSLKSCNKVKFIDDTYNSNPLSLKQALDALEKLEGAGRKIFVMGDMLELGEAKEAFHCEAGFNAAKICDIFIAVGSLSRLAAKEAASCGLKAKSIFTCDSALEARDILVNKISLKDGDIVLVKGSRGMKMENVLNAI